MEEILVLIWRKCKVFKNKSDEIYNFLQLHELAYQKPVSNNESKPNHSGKEIWEMVSQKKRAVI